MSIVDIVKDWWLSWKYRKSNSDCAQVPGPPEDAEEVLGSQRPESSSDIVRIKYCNHNGKVSWRRVMPIKIWNGETRWHPATQVFLIAWDMDKEAVRDFAVRDIRGWRVDGHSDSPEARAG